MERPLGFPMRAVRAYGHDRVVMPGLSVCDRRGINPETLVVEPSWSIYSKARNVTEIRRPVYRVDFGTPCFQILFVSQGITNTVPWGAGKSLTCASTPFPRVRRNTRVSPNETV